MHARWIVTGIVGVAGVALGVLLSVSPEPAHLIGPTPALAGDLGQVAKGETFVSTEGGSAYLWRRNGDRIELVGHCQRLAEDREGQATFVWLPGVERRSP